MQPSMELRWFVKGVLHHDVNKWFETNSVGSNPPRQFKPSIDERHDTYLFLPDRPDLGIKLRAGERIEVKERLHDRGIQPLGAGVEGRVEQWVKWSFMLDSKDGNPPNISFPADAWIDVPKLRRTRKFALSSTNLVVEVEPTTKVEDVLEGCNLELTTLHTRNQSWHTLGFEAFGPMDTVEETLGLVVRALSSRSPFPPMKAQDSFGYPEWLKRVVLAEAGRTQVPAEN